MSRRPPRVEAAGLSIGVEFDPNGSHKMVLESHSAIVALKLTDAQLMAVEAAIPEFRSQCLHVDAGREFHTKFYKPLRVA